MDNEVLQELQSIKKEINNLNKRLDVVTNKIIEQEGTDIIQPATITDKISVIKDNVVDLTKDVEKKINNTSFKDKINNKNIEANIGKNIMGILASILIFIGVSSFVGLIFDNLTETLKMILMYVFSFALLGGGLFGVYKKKNGFTLSLLGCGFGTVYISFLLSHFYFKIFNEFALFGLMIVWSGIIIWLSKK